MLGLSASLLAGRTIERHPQGPPKNPLVLGQPNSPPRSNQNLMKRATPNWKGQYLIKFMKNFMNGTTLLVLLDRAICHQWSFPNVCVILFLILLFTKSMQYNSCGILRFSTECCSIILTKKVDNKIGDCGIISMLNIHIR